MGSIYSNAHCNIAATWASDSSQGCFNERDPSIVTPATVVVDPGTKSSTKYRIFRSTMYPDDISDAPLNCRGWVVQERCLAAKQLSFTKQQVYWECPELIASEQFPNGIPDTAWRHPGDNILSPPTAKPRLNYEHEDELQLCWSSLVGTYSYCHLTRPSDKLIALAGLADEFRNRTKDVYLAGLWNANLHKQLCWIPDPDIVDTNRSRTSQYHAPTWSWASFDGPVCVDTRYCMPERNNAYLIRILNVSVESETKSGLHSFLSGTLEVQGIALWTKVVPTDQDNKFNVRFMETEKRARLLDMESGFVVTWDENLPRSEAPFQPLRWYGLQEERNADLLFMFVACHSPKWAPQEGEYFDDLDGLILRKKADGKFIRMGTFFWDQRCDNQLLDLIASRLELQQDALLTERIILEDPRLADLVHTVNID